MKVVSVLAALACSLTTLSLAYGLSLSGLADIAVASYAALIALLPSGAFGLTEALALLGAGIVFWSSTRRTADM